MQTIAPKNRLTFLNRYDEAPGVGFAPVADTGRHLHPTAALIPGDTARLSDPSFEARRQPSSQQSAHVEEYALASCRAAITRAFDEIARLSQSVSPGRQLDSGELLRTAERAMARAWAETFAGD